jgi:hypothetical protein
LSTSIVLPSRGYKVVAGPEAYLPPSAASSGVVLPDNGQGLIEGEIFPEETVMEKIAEKLLSAKNPVLFPGPLVLWVWSEESVAKALAAQKMAAEVPRMKIIPMPDYRPKYPMINPAIEINPNHPNLTIWHNNIDVCVFIGVHCHFANVALKIIRGGADCYTIALCGEAGHEDAVVTLRDVTAKKVEKLTETIKRVKREGLA